jgi:hypothetical protein
MVRQKYQIGQKGLLLAIPNGLFGQDGGAAVSRWVARDLVLMGVGMVREEFCVAGMFVAGVAMLLAGK